MEAGHKTWNSLIFSETVRKYIKRKLLHFIQAGTENSIYTLGTNYTDDTINDIQVGFKLRIFEHR